MHVADSVRRCVVFIGHYGVNGNFIPDGTGFVVMMTAYEFGMPYVVTAKHVLDQAAGPDESRDIQIRVNTKAGPVDYISTKPRSWHSHPEHVQSGRHRKYVDVGVYSLADYKNWSRLDLEKYSFSCVFENEILTDKVIAGESINTGDEVAIPGLFLSHFGTDKNIPIVRIGNIAAMPDEPLPTSYGLMDGYLIEMRSIGGISGSPVMLNMTLRPPVKRSAPLPLRGQIQPYYLIGLVHGHYTITTQEEWVFKTDQNVGDINAGVAIVVPVSKILETINQPNVFGEAQEMAKKAREQANANSKAIHDAAPGVASTAPSKDENPQHLEDFTALLGAAARKSPRGD